MARIPFFLTAVTALTGLSMQADLSASSGGYSYAYATPTHWITGFGLNGQTIQLEDGSLWSISSMDRYILQSWRRNDPVILTSNPDWFDRGEYYLVNANTQTRLSVNLYDASLLFGPHSHWVIGINYYLGHVTLENGTVWCLHEWDRSQLAEWELDDHLIIGSYNTPYCSCDHILINAELGTMVRAQQY